MKNCRKILENARGLQVESKLVGGFQPEKYARQIGSFPQGSGYLKKKYLKPPPGIHLPKISLQNLVIESHSKILFKAPPGEMDLLKLDNTAGWYKNICWVAAKVPQSMRNFRSVLGHDTQIL